MLNDALGGPATPNGHPNEDDVLLGDDEQEISVVDEEEEEDETPPAADEEVEEEEEEVEEDEEGKKPDIPFDRPTIKELKGAYPDIFKKFPSLRETYFREIEFTKVFPSVEDAKDAVTENEAFSNLSDSALEGDPVPILESLHKTDAKAFEAFSAGFLPALYKQDREAYQLAVTPVIEALFRSAYRSSDEALRNAAVLVSKFVFDEHGEAIAKGEKTVSRAADVLKARETAKEARGQEYATKFRTAYGEVDNQVRSSLRTMILKDIDPNKTFSPFVRQQLAGEAVKRIFKVLESDEGHKSVMSGRWKRAKSSGFSNEDKSKIVSTFLARAKSLIPNASEKVRSLANGRGTERPTTREGTRPKRELGGGRTATNRPSAPSRMDLRRMTDMDILNS